MSAAGGGVILLAGDRGPTDPVAQATGALCKALSPVADIPLLERALATLAACHAFERRLVVGPSADIIDANAAITDTITAAGATWMRPAASPSASAAVGLDALPADMPALITTADHALLQPQMIEALFSGADDADLAVAMIEHERVTRAYPGSHRTAVRLGRGSGYCGCNLFLVRTERGRELVRRWRQVEAQRKHPARVVVGMLGVGALVRYALGRLSLEQAFARLSARTGVRVRPVLLTEPEAAVDVDSVADLRLVESILARRTAA